VLTAEAKAISRIVQDLKTRSSRRARACDCRPHSYSIPNSGACRRRMALLVRRHDWARRLARQRRIRPLHFEPQAGPTPRCSGPQTDFPFKGVSHVDFSRTARLPRFTRARRHRCTVPPDRVFSRSLASLTATSWSAAPYCRPPRPAALCDYQLCHYWRGGAG
jgi:hypothetical protein